MSKRNGSKVALIAGLLFISGAPSNAAQVFQPQNLQRINPPRMAGAQKPDGITDPPISGAVRPSESPASANGPQPGVAASSGGFGSIAGSARLNDGGPAIGVRVAAVALPFGRVESIAASNVTDASGNFKLEHVPAGGYVLRIDSPYFPYPTYFPGTVAAREAEVVTVTAGSAVEGLRLSTSDVLPLNRFNCVEPDPPCFDFDRRSVVEGVMKQVFVQHPGLKAVITVRDALGARDLDLAGPNAAALNDKEFSEIKAGDRVKVVLSPRRDGGPGAFLAGYVKRDGTELIFARPDGPDLAPTSGPAIQINFQPSGAQAPPGYLVDTGAVFGDRGNGYRFGWARENLRAQDRNAPNAPDQRYDTFAQLQLSDSPDIWELELPTGFYGVRLVAGDPVAVNSLYLLNVEGVIALGRVPTSDNRWIDATVRVHVADGRLTVSNVTGSCNNKLAFLEVTPVGSGPVTASGSGATAASVSRGAEPAPSLGSRVAQLAGFVRSPAGVPVPGVRVSVISVDDTPTIFGISQSDAGGRYEIEGIPNGRYYVAAGSLTIPLYHPGVDFSDTATVFTLTGAPLDSVNFSADPARLTLVCPGDNASRR